MKKLTLIAILTMSLFGYPQTQTLTELSKDELTYLSKNIYSGFGNDSKDYEYSAQNPLMTYQYEIQYNGKTIFRDVIQKPSIGNIANSMNRTYAKFCLDYNQFDADTKLEITESGLLKLTTDENGKKWLWTDRYELFAIKYDVLTVNDKISDKLRIKFLKNEYQEN